MSLDAGYLKCLTRQLNQTVKNYKVEKIYQPQKDEIILQLRGYAGAFSLLLSANANNARIGLMNRKYENPAAPPMFCMLLRKHLLGAVLFSIEQQDFDRVVLFGFDGHNELGDRVRKYIAVEIMGRHSNLIFFDEEKRIIDAIKHIDFTVSMKRQVLPGLFYASAPAQDKLNPLSLEKEQIRKIIISDAPKKADKFLQEKFSGLSPLVFREAVFRCCGNTDVLMSQLDQDKKERLFFHFYGIMELIKEESFSPVLICDAATKRPIEFSFMNIRQYGTLALEQAFDDPSVLLEAFYEKRTNAERLHQKGQDIFKVISNAVERVSKKLNNQLAEQQQAKDRERLKICGDLIMANLYAIQKGQTCVKLRNFYSVEGEEIEIGLNENLTPSQNAQKYYREYQKAKTKDSILTVQIQKAKEDLSYLDSVFDNLTKAETDLDFAEIKKELVLQGYLLAPKDQGRKKRKEVSKPLAFLSDDGFSILAGKNNLQNDELTLKTASRQDIWFHVKNIPGSHTVVITNGREVPATTMTQAAVLAATYSKAKDSGNVAVDYTRVKNVKKPSGARPGMVIYESYETAYVNPDFDLAKRLKRK